MNIACVLRWGISSVGIALLGMGKTFQVWDIRRWTALIRDHKGEESRLVAFITHFVKFLEQTSFDMYFYVREF